MRVSTTVSPSPWTPMIIGLKRLPRPIRADCRLLNGLDSDAFAVWRDGNVMLSGDFEFYITELDFNPGLFFGFLCFLHKSSARNEQHYVGFTIRSPFYHTIQNMSIVVIKFRLVHLFTEFRMVRAPLTTPASDVAESFFGLSDIRPKCSRILLACNSNFHSARIKLNMHELVNSIWHMVPTLK